MLPPVRRVGFRSAPEPDFSDFDVEVEAEGGRLPEAPPQDPAAVAATIMLEHALLAAGLTLEDAGRDATVTLVLVPAPDWTDLARDAWKVRVRGGEQYNDNGRDRSWDRGGWSSWTSREEQRPAWHVDAADSFSREMARGRHCVGFAPDEAWLPPDLVDACDFRLALRPFTATDVAELATRLCGGRPTDAFPDAAVAALTPRLLRLARRPGQTADAYVAKLATLAGRQDAAASAVLEVKSAPRDTPTLDRMHGMDPAVAWGMGVARDLVAYRDGRLAWADVDRGCLVSGPPGCGKTLYARALAATCGVPLITGSYGEWHGSGNAHQGDLLKAMRKTFETARKAAPSILFIDEVDSFPDRGAITHAWADWEIQVVNALLAEIDGVEGREGVVLVAACNHPEKLDPALVRSGRLDRHIRIGLPDRPALAAILREHLGDDLAGADLSDAALAASGASGADCERLVRGARRRARSAGRVMVSADLMHEIGGTDDRSEGDLAIAAVHEAGHVVAACILRPGAVGMVSLRGSGEIGGITETSMTVSEFVRPDDLRMRLTMLLAGRAAEEEVLGVPSSAAGGRRGSDLATATAIALHASSSLGLDIGGGLVWRGVPDINGVPGALAADPALADRVRVRLDDAYRDAIELVRVNRRAVEAVAAALVERRVLDGPEAEGIVMRHIPGRGIFP